MDKSQPNPQQTPASYAILDAESTDAAKLHGVQRKRLRTLQLKKQRLIDAYLDGVLPTEDIRPRQEQVAAEIADAELLIRESGNDAQIVRGHVDLLLTLMSHAGDLYRTVSDNARRLLNQAVFTGASVDVSDDEDNPQAREVSLMAALAPPVAAIAELARPGESRPNGPHTARRRATGPIGGRAASRSVENRTPGKLSLPGGSNVFNLVVTAVFRFTTSLTTKRADPPHDR